MSVCVFVCVQLLFDGRFNRDDVTGGSFLSLKARLIGVLIGALQTETDTSNTQIILGQMLIIHSLFLLYCSCFV